MNFDNLRGSPDATNFNKNFDSQINKFSREKNLLNESQFSILQQKRGFAED